MSTRFVYTRRRAKLIAGLGVKLSSSGKHIRDVASQPPHRKPIVQINGKKLDTNIFESYLEDLWGRISDEKKISYTYLDSLWFSLYKNGKTKEKVLQWIKNKELFSWKYIFVPIICWKHWSLLILCNIGERRITKSKKRCMLLLDSFHKLDPSRLEPDIRRFVLDIFRLQGRKDKEESISEIPLLIPKVPQQNNGEECGMFVLYFIYRFLQSAPVNFNMEGYPYFLTDDWFALEDVENFQKEINSFCVSQSSIQIE